MSVHLEQIMSQVMKSMSSARLPHIHVHVPFKIILVLCINLNKSIGPKFYTNIISKLICVGLGSVTHNFEKHLGGQIHCKHLMIAYDSNLKLMNSLQ